MPTLNMQICRYFIIIMMLIGLNNSLKCQQRFMTKLIRLSSSPIVSLSAVVSSNTGTNTNNMNENLNTVNIASSSSSSSLNLRYGNAVNVTILQFGPLGASVSLNDHSGVSGLILQNELRRFRDKRDGDEVKVGETLVGYVERVREDNKVDVSLRPGITVRITEVKEIIMDALLGSPSGTILVGDKSTSEDISSYFHGISKTDFKNAIGSLYREKLIIPGKLITTLAPDIDKNDVDKILQASASPSQRSSSISSSNKFKRYSKTIFIGNLPPNTEQNDLQPFLLELLGGDSVMKQLRLAIDQITKKSRGFAFIDIDDNVSDEDLTQLVNKLKNVVYRGRQLRSDIDKKIIN